MLLVRIITVFTAWLGVIHVLCGQAVDFEIKVEVEPILQLQDPYLQRSSDMEVVSDDRLVIVHQGYHVQMRDLESGEVVRSLDNRVVMDQLRDIHPDYLPKQHEQYTMGHGDTTMYYQMVAHDEFLYLVMLTTSMPLVNFDYSTSVFVLKLDRQLTIIDIYEFEDDIQHMYGDPVRGFQVISDSVFVLSATQLDTVSDSKYITYTLDSDRIIRRDGASRYQVPKPSASLLYQRNFGWCTDRLGQSFTTTSTGLYRAFEGSHNYSEVDIGLKDDQFIANLRCSDAVDGLYALVYEADPMHDSDQHMAPRRDVYVSKLLTEEGTVDLLYHIDIVKNHLCDFEVYGRYAYLLLNERKDGDKRFYIKRIELD